MAQDGELAPFTEAKYEPVTTDREEPSIKLRGELAGAPLTLEIRHEPGGTRFAFALRTGAAAPVVKRLVATGYATATNGQLERSMSRGEATATLFPGRTAVDQCLVESVNGLGRGVIVIVALASHRRLDAGFCQALALLYRYLLRAAVAMADHAFRPGWRARSVCSGASRTKRSASSC